MFIRIFLYKFDAVGTHRLPGGAGFETDQPYRDGLRAVGALRASLPPMVFADYAVARAR